MRKTTINLIVGILIGMLISGISDSVSTDSATSTSIPVATTISSPISVDSSNPFVQQIAPGLQIVAVPPPLNLMGNHPYHMIKPRILLMNGVKSIIKIFLRIQYFQNC